MKTVDFLETIEASNLRRYVSIEGQVYFLTLAQGCVHTKIQTGFSQKLLYRSEPNFS